MADIERILGNDSGKVALEKTDRNMVKVNDESKIITERGYAISKIINSGDISTLNKNGKYQIDTAAVTGVPESYGVAWVEVIGNGNNYFTQILKYVSKKTTYEQNYANSIPQGWEKTTTKTEYDKSVASRGDAVAYFGVAEFNSFNKPGSYLVVNVTSNRPPGCVNWGTLLIYAGGTGALVQEFTEELTNRRWYRHFQGATWRDWVEVCGTKTIPLTLVNGWIPANPSFSTVVTRNGDSVTIDALIYNVAQESSSLYFAETLPVEFRPRLQTITSGITEAYTPVHIIVGNNGNIQISGVSPKHAWISICFTYNLK